MENQGGRIYVASDYHFVNRDFYRQRFFWPALQQSQILRASTAWLEALTVIYNFDGRLYFKDERPYHCPEMDETFGDDQGKWFRVTLRLDEAGQGPRFFSQKYERLRLVELYCRLVGSADWSVWPNTPQPIMPLDG